VRTERTTRKRVPDTPATGASQRDARPAEATPAPCVRKASGSRKNSTCRTTICAEVGAGTSAPLLGGAGARGLLLEPAPPPVRGRLTLEPPPLSEVVAPGT
jgi:hypothetical protein